MHGSGGSTEGWKGNTAPGKSIKLAGFPNPFSLMFLCKFVRWEWNCLVTLQTWRTSLKKITYLSKQGGIYVGVPEMWFYSVCFLCAHQSNWRDKKEKKKKEKNTHTCTQLVYGYFFTLPPFLLLFPPLCLLSPLLPSLFIVCDGIVPCSSTVRKGAMISTHLGPFQRHKHDFPVDRAWKCG